MKIETYRPLGGGAGWELSAARGALAALGVRAPHTGKPFSDSFLLGVSGGVSISYSLESGMPAFSPRNAPHENGQVSELVCTRIGVAAEAVETGSAQKAEDALRAAIATGRPALVLCAEAALPHRAAPKEPPRPYGVLVFGIEDDDALVDDRARDTFRVPLEALGEARAALPQLKNRLVAFGPAPRKLPDVRRGVHAALDQCARDFLDPEARGHGAAALSRWAEQLDGGKDRRAWSKLFARSGLRAALAAAFRAFEVEAQGAHRGLYADFCAEAAQLLAEPQLTACARAYRALAREWSLFADELLPETVEGCHELKAMLRRRHDLLVRAAPVSELAPVQKRLDALLKEKWPQKDPAPFLAHLGERLRSLHAAEVDAAQGLLNALA